MKLTAMRTNGSAKAPNRNANGTKSTAKVTNSKTYMIVEIIISKMCEMCEARLL